MTFKEKIESCSAVCGTFVHISDLMVSEILGSLGYDFAWIDMEHTTLSCEQVRNHIVALRGAGTPAIVRVPVHDLTNTKRILEIGPDGIIFPMVHSYEEAEELISWTMYPPYGERGCGPKGAVRYGLDSEPDYYANGHKKFCRFIQIETKSIVDDIEKIAKMPYLDGCILGMHDLSGSIQRLGDIFCEENLALVMHSIEVLRANNKTVGVATFATDNETLERYHNMGINMITTGADYEYIRKGGLDTLKLIREIQKK